MSKILLLGPGFNTGRLPTGSKPFGRDPAADELTVVDRDRAVLDFWRPLAAKCLCADLREVYGNILLRALDNEAFDEVHAYEVLNVLPGDSADFFRFWRFIWDALKVGGRVWATVPHWESQWIHAYPGPQRTYTPGLLGYLDQDSSNPAQEKFPVDWPEPYCFKLENSWVLSSAEGPEGKPMGWHFCLVKMEAKG